MDTVPSFDLYRELEVDPKATTETIEAAWRSLVKRHHPDVASDGPAAREKIKRLNLAHEWLADRRLREMYDLTQGRRRHAPVRFDEPVRVVPAAPVEGRRYRASALISTAVVAVLAAAAFGSIVVNQAPQADDGARAGAAPPSVSASVLGAAVAPATSPAATAEIAGATSPPNGSAGLPDPAFDSDMPAGCVADGRVDRAGSIDGRDARMIFLRCGEARAFGPLLYAWSGSGWTKLEGAKSESAIAADAGFGSMTGDPNEYWVAWAGPAGRTWVAAYRVEPGGPRAFWHSMQDDDLVWQDATVRLIPNEGPRGKLQLEFTEGSDTCRSCPGQAYVEVYEWLDGKMQQTYRGPAASP